MHAQTRSRRAALALTFTLGALLGAILASTPNLQRAHAAPAQGIPNPADDRNRMIAELQRLNASADAIRDAITSGKLKVTVAQNPSAPK
ncbi:MAG: hypothetical protein AB7G17_03130 [Phycisphaerales bacterium]